MTLPCHYPRVLVRLPGPTGSSSLLVKHAGGHKPIAGTDTSGGYLTRDTVATAAATATAVTTATGNRAPHAGSNNVAHR